MLKKQYKLIAACAGAALILLILYFALVMPLIRHFAPPPVTVDILLIGGESINVRAEGGFRTITVEEGETKTVTIPFEDSLIHFGWIQIMPPVNRSDIRRISVSNSEGRYSLVHVESSFFVIEGAEMTPVNDAVLPGFFATAGRLMTMERAAARGIDDGDELLSDLSRYGLERPAAYFEIELIDVVQYRILIGDRTPLEDGYYVMLDGRPAVYVMDRRLDIFFEPAVRLLDPIITLPIPQTQYFLIDNFRIYRDDELFIEISQGPDSGDLGDFIMTYPGTLEVSPITYPQVLSTFISFRGENVLGTIKAFDENDEEDKQRVQAENQELLERFGLFNPARRISFTFGNMPFNIFFSELNTERNIYYVFSPQFASVIEMDARRLYVSESRIPFIEWDIIHFVDQGIFARNINDVREIDVRFGGERTVFVLDGIRHDGVNTLAVTGNGRQLDINNFTQYYWSILLIQNQGFEERPEDAVPMLTMTVTMRDGERLEYAFYFAGSLRCFYTLNGEGQFWVPRANILKLMDDTLAVLDDRPINPFAPSQ